MPGSASEPYDHRPGSRHRCRSEENGCRLLSAGHPNFSGRLQSNHGAHLDQCPLSGYHYQPYALRWSVRWSHSKALSPLSSASRSSCPTTRPLDWCKRKWCEAQQPKQCRRTIPAAMKPVIPSLPRHFQRIRRDQEASWVAVSSSVHSGASAGHGQTILQGEVRGDRLQQDQRRTLRGLLPRTEAMLVLRLTLRGVVLALRLALRNPSLQIEQFEARVRFANKFSMSAMRWIRVRKLGLNLRKESTYLRTHYVIAMKQCVKWRSIPTTTEMYQQYISTEAEYMRESLASAARIMSKQPEALADAHLVDEGSTMRIYEDHGAWLSQ